MTKEGPCVFSGEAARMTGADVRNWRKAAHCGWLDSVAPDGDGQKRLYYRDDLVAMLVFSDMRLLGFTIIAAARIANGVRQAMHEQEDLKEIRLVRGAIEIPLAIASMRARCRELLDSRT